MKRKKLILVGIAAAVACALGITACAQAANNVRMNVQRAVGDETTKSYSFAFATMGSDGWGGYADHVAYDDSVCKITLKNASKQSSTVTDVPVTKAGDTIVAIKGYNVLTSVSFVLKQWNSKAKTVSLQYSTDAGATFSEMDPAVSSDTFAISSDSLPSGTNAVKMVQGNTGNQVGIVSTNFTYRETAAPSDFTVTFVTNGGTFVDPQTVASGGKAVEPTSPTKQDFTFVGWYSDADLTNEYDFDSSVNGNLILYAKWSEVFDEGASTYNLSDMFDNGASWTSYANQNYEFEVSNTETASVSIISANHQSSTITDVPVSKGGDVKFVLNSDARYIKNITFHARQWGSKEQTMSLYSSLNGGTSYENTGISSSDFRIRGTNFDVGTNAIKITFDSQDNQVGYVDFVVTYANLPSVEATSMVISPASLSLYGEEQGTFIPTLVGGQGNYEKTITWVSSHPSIIAAPANSEADAAINVTPARVNADTDVTLTGTVDVANGASASIVITVKLIKEISVNSVVVSGIENNSTFDGSNDNTIAVNSTKQLSATVNYEQGNAYMDGNNSVSWLSSNPAVATVDSNGLVTLLGDGTVTISATSVENSQKSGAVTFVVSNINDELGTENNPYTVAQARAAIDANIGVTNVYAKGIVSAIVTPYSSQYGNITYDVSANGSANSDQLRVYRGKGVNGENFSSENDILVGDEVVVFGSLTNYKGTYEFAEGNQLVSKAVAPFDLNRYLSFANSIATIHGSVESNTGEIVFEDENLDNGVEYTDSFERDNFSIQFSSGCKYYNSGAGMRVYGGGSFTITKKSVNISKVVLTWDGSNKPTTNNVVDSGSFNSETSVWTGDAESVTFTRPSGSGHWRLKTVEVTCGDASLSVTNVNIKFGVKIPQTAWQAILDNNLEISEYGVMLFKRNANTAYPNLTVEQAYENNMNYNVAKVTSGALPAADDEGNYIFSARVNIKESNYGVVFCASAYVVIGGQHYFLDEMMEYSVRSLANHYYGDTGYEYLSQDALSVLKGN